MYAAIAGMERVLTISRVSEHTGFAFLRSAAVYSDRLVIFPGENYDIFLYAPIPNS